MKEGEDFGSDDDDHAAEGDIQGVILVQLLVLSHYNDESCGIFDHVYLQLTCGKYVKRTHVMPFATHKETMIDAVKHFPINLPISRATLKSYNLKLEMIMYKASKDNTITIEKRQMGVMLFHLRDMMSNRSISGTHEFSKDMNSMAKLELKICYSSGFFGFGYSRRINFETEAAGEESEFPEALEEQLLLSMFPRYHPPEDRVDPSRGGILSVKEVPIPDILPQFDCPTDPAADKFLNEESWANHPCETLMKDCQRLRRLRIALLSCDSYRLRKVFLEKLILHNQEMTLADIKKHTSQKEENSDHLQTLINTAEKAASMDDPSYVRRMSSNVNPADIAGLLKAADRAMMDAKMKAANYEDDEEDGEKEQPSPKSYWQRAKEYAMGVKKSSSASPF